MSLRLTPTSYLGYEMTIQFKKLKDNAIVPIRQTPGAAGFDLHSAATGTEIIYRGEVRKIPTGVAVAIPEGHVGLIRDRSSLGAKGLSVLGGVIDSDYRGEISVLLAAVAMRAASVQIPPGARVAQLVIVPYLGRASEAESLPETERGAAGFGSTGV